MIALSAVGAAYDAFLAWHRPVELKRLMLTLIDFFRYPYLEKDAFREWHTVNMWIWIVRVVGPLYCLFGVLFFGWVVSSEIR
jgi:hypothetical protein